MAALRRSTPHLHRRMGTAGAIAVVAAVALLVACSRSSPSPSPAESAAASPLASAGPTSASAGPSGSPRGSTIPPLPTGPDRLALEPVIDGLDAPVGIVSAADGSGRLFVLQRGGVVRVIGPDGALQPAPFIDLSGRVLARGERGLLGLAFHPEFERNGRLFVHYSRSGDGATVVSELRADSRRAAADAGTERLLLTQAQPFANHNGGKLAFGPDGYLYLGLGDGGSAGDPLGNAQNTGVLLGKMLRLDVDSTPPEGRAYAIPPDNPFAAGGIRPGAGLPEIWAYGLRNPWQFSFDPDRDDLYIADVGQSRWEEVNRQPSDSRGGENYGWPVMEGRHCFQDGCDQAGYVKPIAEYSHEQGCSVTGGEVYRGSAQPELTGIYVFGDYCSGILFTLHVDEGTVTPKVVLDSELRISAFGTDEDGEIYVADIAGSVYRVLVDD